MTAEEGAPHEVSSVTEHTIRIGGQTISYNATAATMLLKNDSGAPIGSLYFTAYTKNGVTEESRLAYTCASRSARSSPSAARSCSQSRRGR